MLGFDVILPKKAMALSFLQFKGHQKNNLQYLYVTLVTGADPYLVSTMSRKSVRFSQRLRNPGKGTLES